MKITLTWAKKLQYPNVHFSVLSPFFLLSFDLSLSCKLQLIDLITVFAAFLVGRQTILVSFFFRERRNRKETNGWKNKSHRNWTLQIHLSRFVRKIVCPVSKNAIKEWFFFWHYFNIGQPCKQYNFQTCLRDNLVPRMLEMAFQSFQISKFSGGACPQTPLG